MIKNKGTSIGKKVLGVVSAVAFTLSSLTVAQGEALKDVNVLIENKKYDGGYIYINTYNKSRYYGKSAFKLTYEYVELDADGKYADRDTNQQETIDYTDTFEFQVFDVNWGGWNVTKAGRSSPVVGTTYTATVQISDIESELSTGRAVQGISFQTGRIGDTKIKLKALEFVNDTSVASSPVRFTGSWKKGTGGTMTKQSGQGAISTDQWKIDITNLCVNSFKNPTIDVAVDYGATAPNRNLQAEIYNGINGKPIVAYYPKVSTAGEVTYTTEFHKNMTSLSVCFDECTVKSIKIYDNTAGNVANSTLFTGKTAAQTAASMGIAWNLGNALECVDTNGEVNETCFGNPVTTKKLIQAVKAQGFNTIRIPVSYLDKINSNYTVDKDYLARIKQVVDYAYDMGMYVIINMQNDGGQGISSKWLDITKTGADFDSVKEKYAAVWDDIAEYFEIYDQRLVFEGFNELMNGNYNGTPTNVQFANVNALNQAFVTAVRGAGSRNTDRVLIVAGYNTNIDYTIAKFTKPTDTASNRLMLSVHYCDPYDFTLNENGTASWGSDDDIDIMIEQLLAISEFGDNQGMPVFLGEYGAIDKSNISAREEYGYQLNYYAAALGNIVTAYWDNGITYQYGTALFDRMTNTVTTKGSRIIAAIKQGKSLED